MRGFLLTLTLLLSVLTWSFGQVVLEDFEDGGKLTWNPLQGSFEVVDNPPGGDTLMLNSSAKVGAYTKQDMSAYSPLLTQFDTPLDLSVNNQFRIKVKSPKRGFFIFKLENPNNSFSREIRRFIPITNQWLEYTLNFSELKDRTDMVKIVLFFDAGVDAGSDTYLFDDIVVEPSGACEGVAKDVEVIDDFECQRNVVIGQPGYTNMEVIDNPDPSGVNTSAKVGKFTDGGGPFYALVYDYGEGIPLGDRSIVKLQVWTSKPIAFRGKLEGGGSPAKESSTINITDVNQWVDVTIDFSDQIGASHQKLVFFFNFAVDDPAGEIYYVDNVRLEPIPPKPALEDFEDGPRLVWESLQNNPALNGTFNGAIANPDAQEPNTSANVGSYTKGTSALGGLQALLPVPFDLSEEPQLNLQVWAPQGATSFSVQLFSPVEGLKLVTRPIEQTQQWIDLSFNFEEFKDVTDFERIELYFDRELTSSDTWYFDNLTQSAATTDPCEGTVPVPTIVDDYDCQRNVTVATSSDIFKVVNNPKPGQSNPDTRDKVGEYTDPFGPFDALVYNFDGPLDLSQYSQLVVKIWSPKVVPLGFKLEGSATNNPIEIVTNVTVAEQWVTYTTDFSPAAGKGYTRLAIFFNFGVTPTETDVYYIDDIEWRLPPYTGCIVDFETPATTIATWRTFANGPDEDVNVVVENPDKSGINTSNFVGQFIEKPAGENFAGMYTVGQPAPIALPNGERRIRMKVWFSKEARVVFKLERSVNGTPQTGDTFSETDYTTPGQWQELTWDFSSKNIPDGEQWNLMTIIPDFASKPADANRVSYFDDIRIGDAQCGQTTSIFATPEVDRLRIFPNPAADRLTIENTEGLTRFVIFNTLGQRMSILQATGLENLSVDLDHLKSGVYILNGYDEQGRLRANAKFVKQ